MVAASRRTEGVSQLEGALPRVAVIVLTYCNESEAAACLESLARSTYRALTVVVVDNASPDHSAERLRARFPNVVHLQAGTNGGYTAGNNRGIEWALTHDADYIMVLNDDTDVDPDCVSRLVQAAVDTGVAAVVPQILYFDQPETVWYAGGIYSRLRAMGTHLRENQPVDRSQKRMAITFACGCCFLAHADVFRAVGGFDESYFTYVEDLEFSIRLQSAGYTLLYEPTARVLHRIGRAAPPTPRQIVLRDTNRRRMVRRHYSVAERLGFALWFYPTRAIHLVRYLSRRDGPRARAIVTGAMSPIAGSFGRTQLTYSAVER